MLLIPPQGRGDGVSGLDINANGVGQLSSLASFSPVSQLSSLARLYPVSQLSFLARLSPVKARYFSGLGSCSSYNNNNNNNVEVFRDLTPFVSPVEYQYSKNRKRDMKVITMSIWSIRDTNLFVTSFIKSVPHNHYSVFIRFQHDGYLYKMAGYQFGFIFTNDEQIYEGFCC